MKYRLSVAVLVPSELLHAFDPNYEQEFVAVREQGTIVLRPNISYEGTSCELMKTDYRRGYFAGMKEGYFQGYTDALECDEPANIEDDSNEQPSCEGQCNRCPHYDDLFETCRYFFS